MEKSYIFCLLKVVSYYDLSVLSMSLMGFQKKLDRVWVGGWGKLSLSLYLALSLSLSLSLVGGAICAAVTLMIFRHLS